METLTQVIQTNILEIIVDSSIRKVDLQRLYRAFLRDKGGAIPVRMIYDNSGQKTSILLGKKFFVSGQSGFSTYINSIEGLTSSFKGEISRKELT